MVIDPISKIKGETNGLGVLYSHLSQKKYMNM